MAMTPKARVASLEGLIAARRARRSAFGDAMTTAERVRRIAELLFQRRFGCEADPEELAAYRAGDFPADLRAAEQAFLEARRARTP